MPLNSKTNKGLTDSEHYKPPFNKGSGERKKLGAYGWALLNEEVSFPVAVLKEDALINNAKWMQDFSRQANVKLAPHGKTSMAPELFKLQLEQGSWGISLATIPQVINAYNNGIKRIILANQLIGKFHYQQIAELLVDKGFEFYCFVDSVENIKQLGDYFEQRGIALNILIEVGIAGGRCGWRDITNLEPLLSVIAIYPCLKLCGLSFYEGVIQGSDAESTIADFVKDTYALTCRLAEGGLFATENVLLTGAGSAWYDIVAKNMVKHETQNENFTIGAIIRPGCYLIHDTGIYHEAQSKVIQRSQLACDLGGDLMSSLELWAYVHSIPEPGLVIVGLGKRDVAFDAGLPKPEWLCCTKDKIMNKAPPNWQVVKIMDQHCMLKVDEESILKPGDLIGFSSSHPCLTMDKWRHIGIIDKHYVIHKTIETFF